MARSTGVNRLLLPLNERRRLLPDVVNDSGLLQSLDLPGSAADVVAAVSALGLKGIVAKRNDSRRTRRDRCISGFARRLHGLGRSRRRSAA